jgi:hypothetical protein
MKVLLAALLLTQGIPVCMPHGVIAEKLKSKYNESLYLQGRTAIGNVMRLYVSPKGTWTILVSTQTQTCFVVGGDLLQVGEET